LENGELVTSAIGICPVQFNDKQRQALKDATLLVGVETIRIITEPVAAAYWYDLTKMDQSKEKLYLVCNLGATSLDLTVLDIDGGVVEFLASASETQLSGTILNTMAGSERQFFDKTAALIKQVLLEAKTETKDLDGIVLTGSPAQFAILLPFIKEHFDKTPLFNSIMSNEVIIRGAAIHAQVFSDPDPGCTWVMHDVTSLSLGIEMDGGVFRNVVARNTVIPAMKSVVISTVVDNQKKIKLRIIEGERRLCSINSLLGTLEIDKVCSLLKGVGLPKKVELISASSFRPLQKEHCKSRSSLK